MADIISSYWLSGETSNEYIDARVKVVIESSIATNSSKVTASLQYQRNNTGFTTSGTGTFSVRFYAGSKLLGESKGSKQITITSDSWVTARSYSMTFEHDSDGNHAEVQASCEGSIPGTTLTSSSARTLISFPTIPRATSIDSVSCATSYFTGALTYKYTPQSASLYNRCNISLNLDGDFIAVKSINLGQKAASQQTATVTLSESELSTIYNQLPSATRGTLRFTMRTYSDSGYSTQIGDAAYKEISLSIPNTTATQPTVTMTLSPVNDFTSSSAIYVKGLSKVKAAFTDGAGKYGATIASYKLTVESKDYGSPYTSAYLTGSGSISVKGTVTDSRGFSRSYSQTITVKDYAKPTIDLLSCSTSYFNGTMTYKYTPANAEFYSRCVVALNINSTYTQIKEILLGVKAAAQQTATLNLAESELSTIYEKFPSSTKGTLRFTFSTYVDANYSEQVGETDYKEITLSIPNIDATQPTATMTLSPVTSLAAPFNTLYIKGKSKLDADFSGGAGKYGATVTSYSMSVEGKDYADPHTTDNYLLNPGSVTVKGIVTDSRGFSRTYTKDITVIDYGAPKILAVSGESEVIAARCDSGGNLVDNGTYLKIKAKRSYSKVVSSGVQKNFCSIQYRYRVEGGTYSSWTTILAGSASSDEIVTGALLDGILSVERTYNVQVRAVDDIGEVAVTTIMISTEKVYMHKAGSINSLGIGKYAEEGNTIDIAEEITTVFRGGVTFKSEAWVELPLGTGVTASTVNSGRWGGTGVFYRVCAGGKHIYVAFNVAFTTSSSTVRAESYTIPYPPSYDVYALCPVGFSDGSRGIATVSVSPKGRVNIYAVHKLPGATLSTGEAVKWIDGYIDYWT